MKISKKKKIFILVITIIIIAIIVGLIIYFLTTNKNKSSNSDSGIRPNIGPVNPDPFDCTNPKTFLATRIPIVNGGGNSVIEQIFKGPNCTNPIALSSFMDPYTYTTQMINCCTSSLIQLGVTFFQYQFFTYIELWGPLTCGFNYCIDGSFEPMSSTAQFKLYPQIQNKIFFIYTLNDISPFNLYVYNQETHFTMCYTIQKAMGITGVVSSSNNIKANYYAYSADRNSNGSQSALAAVPFMIIAPELQPLCKPSDPTNIINVYNKTNQQTTYHGSIYQSLLCCSKPIILNSILNRNSSLVPENEAILFPTGYLNYTCIVIYLLGNLSAGFSRPDVNGIFDSNRYNFVNCNIQHVGENILAIKHIKDPNNSNDFGTIYTATIYVQDNTNGTLQIFTFGRAITANGQPISGNTPIQVEAMQVNPYYPQMANIYTINSPMLSSFTPAYLFIGPATFGDNLTPPPDVLEPKCTPLPKPQLRIMPLPSGSAACIPLPPIIPINPKRSLLGIPPIDANTAADIINSMSNPDAVCTTESYIQMFGNRKTEIIEKYVGGIASAPVFLLPQLFPYQIEEPRDQRISPTLHCGACWAMCVVSCLGDRFALMYGIKCPKPSTLWLLTACSESEYMCAQSEDIGPNGCMGGYPKNAFIWLSRPGNFVKLEECWPYSVLSQDPTIDEEENIIAPSYLGNDPDIPDNCCDGCCPPQNNVQTLRAGVKFSINPSSYWCIDSDKKWGEYTIDEVQMYVTELKEKIACSGPVISSIILTDQLKLWYTNILTGVIDPSTVFQSTTNTSAMSTTNFYRIDKHTLVITGWGINNGVEYWQCRNTNGSNLPGGGFMNIAISSFDSQSMWVGPDIPNFLPARAICLPIAFTPNPIDNLDELIANGIFERVPA